MEKEQFSKQLNDESDIRTHRRRHLLQYLLLVIIFIVTVSLLNQLNNSILKIVVITALASLYLFWGVWHHKEENNLSRVHFFEYLMISVFIFIVLFFVFVGT